MISAERADHVGEQDDIPLVPDAPFREVTDIVIACQTRTVLARCLGDRANSVRASSQCPTPILQKETRLTDIVRALRIRKEWKAGLHSLLSNVPPLQREPASLLWSQKSRSVRG